MGAPFRTLPDLKRNGVEHVIVTLTNRIVMRVFLGELDLPLRTPTARRVRAGCGSHAARLSRRGPLPTTTVRPLALDGISRTKGPPDIVGIREPKKSDIVKFPTEIVSAEVKIDPVGLITAFGQACAYRLFSHKSYIVVPDDSDRKSVV